MGLHPQAIISIILQILELLQLGYKVILSTHSTVILEFAWAFNLLKPLPEDRQHKALNEIFHIANGTSVANMLNGVFNKSIHTYYFHRDNSNEHKVISQDISSLDAGELNNDIAEWGGISAFASHVSDVIAKYI